MSHKESTGVKRKHGEVTEVPSTKPEGSKKEEIATRVLVSRTTRVRDLALLKVESTNKKNVFFPVAPISNKSVLSQIFRDNDPRDSYSYFQRSARSLRDHVKSLSYLPVSGGYDDDEAMAVGATPRIWRVGIVDDGPPSFDNNLVLDATLEAEPNETNMQVRRVLLLYDDQTFENDIISAFDTGGTYSEALSSGKLDGVDLTIEIFNQPMYVTSVMTILITACSSSTTRGRQDRAIAALFPRLRGGHTELLTNASDIHSMGSGAPEGTKLLNLGADEYSAVVSAPTSESERVLEWLNSAIKAAASDQNQNMKSHIRLLNEDNQLYVYAAIFQPDDQTNLVDILRLRPPQPLRSLEPRSSRANTIRPFLKLPTLLTARRAIPVSVATFSRADPLLDGISVTWPSDPNYDEKRGQYASFDGTYPDGDFRPFLIAHPETVDEIKNVVDFAVKTKKRVVVRSGGHQYCGYSSGDQNSIQIVMDDMRDEPTVFQEPAEKVRAKGCSIVSPDGNGDQWFVTIPVKYRLKQMSAYLKERNLTVPHGECPLVGIGGHAQTGGYGHQSRGLGLCLDYVYSFVIVLYDRSGIRELTVYRPELSGPNINVANQSLNDDIYKGVMGGSPGAFGVVVSIQFLAAHDEDSAFSDSRDMRGVYPYVGRDIGQRATEVIAAMLRLTSPSNPLEDGLDVFISIVSLNVGNFELGVVMAELAYTGNNFSRAVKQQLDEINDACKSGVLPWLGNLIRGDPLRKRSPSLVAHKGVRTTNSGVTEEGREFDLPYKKRVSVTLSELSGTAANMFAQEFGRLAAKVVLDKDLKLVIQAMMGGGKLQTNDPEGHTGLPYRDQTFLFVFDIFHENDNGAKSRADQIQNEMQALLTKIGGFENRVFWGSFGREYGETNMTQSQVRNWYYESAGAYREMQQIKRRLDPRGIFTTEFTVQNR